MEPVVLETALETYSKTLSPEWRLYKHLNQSLFVRRNHLPDKSPIGYIFYLESVNAVLGFKFGFELPLNCSLELLAEKWERAVEAVNGISRYKK